MRISAPTPIEALNETAQGLHLSPQAWNATESVTALIAQSLRRCAFQRTPCRPHDLCDAVTVALAPILNLDDLKDRVEAILDDLVAFGDLFESDEGAKLLRPAPPAIVARRDGSVILLGVAGEDIDPFLSSQIVHLESGLRLVKLPDGMTTEIAVNEHGLIQLSDRAWLHAPKKATASEFHAAWIDKLPPPEPPRIVEELEVLDPSRSPLFYKGRWVKAAEKHSGVYLARRPQRFRANLWSIVELKNGQVTRLVDVHSRDSRIRSCDEAWRFQAAADALANTPQIALLAHSNNRAILSLGSPLPSWACRRLSAVGKQTHAARALVAFELDPKHAEQEAAWLSEMLWLRIDRGTERDSNN